MQIYRYNGESLAIPKKKRAIALGFFDGVHIGHRKILEFTVNRAKEMGLTPSVFTFISESDELKTTDNRLYTTEQKLTLIKECGIEDIIIADFLVLRDMTGEEFVNDFLIGRLGATLTVSGADFRFGKGAKHTAADLSRLMECGGGESIIVPDVKIGEKRVSTTYIKELLRGGNIKEANECLGTPYFIISNVERGRGVGRTLGFPTINSPIEKPITRLRSGVYITEAIINSTAYPAISNVGICPTFSPRDEHIETYILDFDENLYGSEVKIIFHSFLRDEIKFSSENELIMQIKVDINRAKEEFFGK